MSEFGPIDRRQLLAQALAGAGAASLLPRASLAADQPAGAPPRKGAGVKSKKTNVYCEQAEPKTVTIEVGIEGGTVQAKPCNGSVRLNMDDTLRISAGGRPFTLKLTPLCGSPPNPFVNWSKDEKKDQWTWKGKEFEDKVREFLELPLPFYKYTIEVEGGMLDPPLVIDGRVTNPWICPGGKCGP
jgi:hypothetical protein